LPAPLPTNHFTSKKEKNKQPLNNHQYYKNLKAGLKTTKKVLKSVPLANNFI